MSDDRELPTVAAARFARAGLKVFPVDMRPDENGQPHKQPLHGYMWKQRATSVMSEVVDDFLEAEHEIGSEFVGIAWALGQDRKCALDLDGEEPDWWGDLPMTAVNVTKRGYHLIFDQPEGRRIGNGTSRFPTEGWGEVRGVGGYIIVWWSDRPGLDVAELDKVVEFPHPAWLTDAGDEADAVSPAQLEAFKAAHTAGHLGRIKGFQTLMAARAPGVARNHHACVVACWIAREAAAGLVPARESFAALEEWWGELAATPDHDTGGNLKTRKLTVREIRGVERWAVGTLTPERIEETRAKAAAEEAAYQAAQKAEEEALFRTSASPASSDSSARVRITHQSAALIVPGRPEWLIKGWLLSRALNLLTGRQGSGKTTFAAHVISAVTNGQRLLDDDEHDPIRAAVLSLEEPPDRVVARLHAAHADLDRVLILGDVEDTDNDGKPYRRRWQLPKDISILGTLIEAEDIGLVIIDGLGYSIAGDSHNYAVVGSALAALAGEAERSGAAVLGLVHPPKGSSDPITAAIGSTAWTAIPRISLVLGVDPTDESGERRAVRVAKTNYREPETGFVFKIGDDPTWECGFVTGMRRTDLSAEEIVAAPVSREEKGERAEARDILRTLLEGGAMDAEQVQRSCPDVSKRTLMRARKDIGVVSTPRRNDKGKVVGWTLSLPEIQSANPRVPTEDWHSGHSGHTQDLYKLSLPECQESKAGTLDDQGAALAEGMRLLEAAFPGLEVVDEGGSS